MRLALALTGGGLEDLELSRALDRVVPDIKHVLKSRVCRVVAQLFVHQFVVYPVGSPRRVSSATRNDVPARPVPTINVALHCLNAAFFWFPFLVIFLPVVALLAATTGRNITTRRKILFCTLGAMVGAGAMVQRCAGSVLQSPMKYAQTRH